MSEAWIIDQKKDFKCSKYWLVHASEKARYDWKKLPKRHDFELSVQKLNWALKGRKYHPCYNCARSLWFMRLRVEILNARTKTHPRRFGGKFKKSSITTDLKRKNEVGGEGLVEKKSTRPFPKSNPLKAPVAVCQGERVTQSHKRFSVWLDGSRRYRTRIFKTSPLIFRSYSWMSHFWWWRTFLIKQICT